MQMEAYSRYFDKTVAIIAPRHLDKLNVEDLCGAALWTYDDFGRLTVLSHGVQTFVDLSHRQDVLTKAEFERMDFSQAIEARYGATSRRFWSATARRSIRSTDLPLLSRFSEARAAARELTAAREARWAEWLAAQAPHVAALA
jgi:hypothetical protein